MTTFTPPAMSPTAQETQKVADRLYELCNAGKWHETMQELYADDAQHVEAMEMPGCGTGRISKGKKTLLELSEKWMKTTTVHSASVGKPLVNDNQFICQMTMDCTSHEGPMAGQRMNMSEQCLYTVKNGKITEAKFFYSCGA